MNACEAPCACRIATGHSLHFGVGFVVVVTLQLKPVLEKCKGKCDSQGPSGKQMAHSIWGTQGELGKEIVCKDVSRDHAGLCCTPA